MVKVRNWILSKDFQGDVNKNDFKLFEEDLSDDLQPGG